MYVFVWVLLFLQNSSAHAAPEMQQQPWGNDLISQDLRTVDYVTPDSTKRFNNWRIQCKKGR